MDRISALDFAAIFSDKEPVTNVTEDIHDQDETEEPDGNRGRQIRTQSREKTAAVAPVSVFDLPIRGFILEALKTNAEANTLSEAAWHSPAWTLTRLCKGHPDLENLDAVSAWRCVRSELRKAERKCIDVWYSLGADEDETEIEFQYAWDKIRIHPAKDIVTDAIDRAKSVALKPPVDRGQTYARFVSIAAHLQKIRGSEPILVPVEFFGSVLGCSKMTVSRMIYFAIADCLLQIVESHDYSRHKARRYKFALERYPTL